MRPTTRRPALAAELLAVGERHSAEHDVYHLTRTLSGWAERHAQLLAEQAARYELDLDAEVGEQQQHRGPLARPRENGSELADERPEQGLALLRHLRDLHLAAARASLAWTVLGQGAQAVGDTVLLESVSACHPETIRTLKWTVQKVKEASPQLLAG